MKKLNVLFWGLLLLVSACESITVIQSTPNGARVYINGMHVGETPYTYTDDKIIFSKTSLRVEKEGYETASLILVRNESAEMGPIVGGFFTGGLTWLWSLGYEPERIIELKPLGPVAPKQLPQTDEQLAKLRLLKQLKDEGIINQEEYEARKKKILEETE